MFGYIKLDGYAPKLAKDYFRKNYCFLCRALDRHYGFFSRLFVSFDVTLFCVLFSKENYLYSLEKVKCFKSNELLKTRLNEEFAKKVAALNLALAAGDIKDKINDKDKFYAKPIYTLYGRAFKKIKKEYPLMWDIIEKGHDEMNKIEDVNGPIEDIENCFANLIERIAREVFNEEDENKINVIKYVSKMLYFMDAVDDIDKDVLRNSYNGLKVFKSKKEYVTKNYDKLREHLNLLRSNLENIEGKSLNALVVNRILDFGIPETLTKICFKEIDL